MPRFAHLIAAVVVLASSAVAKNCYGPGERNQGESGHPAVPYKPCCSGKQATKVYGKWGFFCPEDDPGTDKNCYGPGERNQGESGHPAVPYKPCCSGKQATKVYGKWGFFCPEGDPGPNPNCYKPGERNQGAPGYPPVPYKPCCDGGQAVKKNGDWGFFCPDRPDVTQTPSPQPDVTQTPSPQPDVTQTPSPQPDVTPTQSPQPDVTPTSTPTPSSQPDVCEGIGGVRPNADPIGDDDWSCYERGVLAMQANGVWKRFEEIHSQQGAHGGALFLVWHRAMLWEFEKALNAVEPGCKIPAYDSAAGSTGVINPEALQIFTDNRAGTCASLGPFSDIPSLSRSCSSEDIFDSAAMNNAITGVGSAATGTQTDTNFLASYDEFNTWMEGVHGNFHVAVGGSMGSTNTAARDPVFYMHHAYIDKVWRQWQNARGGNDFGGERNTGEGDFVDTNVALEPWGMTADDVITRISGCIDYENENGGPVTRIEIAPAVRQGEKAIIITEDEDEGNPTAQGYAAPVVPVVEKETKNAYQLEVAEEKINNPQGYEDKVLDAKRKEEACVKAMRKLGTYSEIFIKTWQRLEGFRLLALERIDLADAEIAQEAENSGSTEAIVSEGRAEKAAIESGEDLASVNPKKVDEEDPTTIVTTVTKD